MSIFNFSVVSDHILVAFKQELNAITQRLDKIEIEMQRRSTPKPLNAETYEKIITILTEDLNDFKAELKRMEQHFREDIHKNHLLINTLSIIVNKELKREKTD